MQPDKEVITRWNNSAQFWEKHREVIRQMFAPVAQALIDDAKIGAGQTVLDVATGPGEPALSVAELVGPEGKVVGVDPIPRMIEGGRRAANRLGLKNVKFEVAHADRLPFSDATFDSAISRFGIMFFPSPLEGIREMLRVLKPEGKLAFAVWCSVERNPFHSVLSQILDRLVEPTPPAPDAPDAFRFASPGKLLRILSEAGVPAPTERVLQFKIEAAVSAEEFCVLRGEMSESFHKKLATLSPHQSAEVKHLALNSFRKYSTDGGMSFPAEVLIVSGAKSRK
ncbi:MAG TPA: methyltransferase domain-containing protein [Candidatus Acidoferrales bacterium]|jgi:ubiquinone/menaquinone biosynthesis C-methylase UbiE